MQKYNDDMEIKQEFKFKDLLMPPGFNEFIPEEIIQKLKPKYQYLYN
jgi:hypothetical protein